MVYGIWYMEYYGEDELININIKNNSIIIEQGRYYTKRFAIKKGVKLIKR
jgi:hypothetical protein